MFSHKIDFRAKCEEDIDKWDELCYIVKADDLLR